MFIKAFINYLQIQQMINNFDVKLPDWINFIPNYLGDVYFIFQLFVKLIIILYYK